MRVWFPLVFTIQICSISSSRAVPSRNGLLLLESFVRTIFQCEPLLWVRVPDLQGKLVSPFNLSVLWSLLSLTSGTIDQIYYPVMVHLTVTGFWIGWPIVWLKLWGTFILLPHPSVSGTPLLLVLVLCADSGFFRKIVLCQLDTS